MLKLGTVDDGGRRETRRAARGLAFLMSARPRELPTRRDPLLSVLILLVLKHAPKARVGMGKHGLVLRPG